MPVPVHCARCKCLRQPQEQGHWTQIRAKYRASDVHCRLDLCGPCTGTAQAALAAILASGTTQKMRAHTAGGQFVCRFIELVPDIAFEQLQERFAVAKRRAA